MNQLNSLLEELDGYIKQAKIEVERGEEGVKYWTAYLSLIEEKISEYLEEIGSKVDIEDKLLTNKQIWDKLNEQT